MLDRHDQIATYRRYLTRMNEALADPCTWAQLPRLLEELGCARSAIVACRPAEETWVNDFVGALHPTGAHIAPGRSRANGAQADDVAGPP